LLFITYERTATGGVGHDSERLVSAGPPRLPRICRDLRPTLAENRSELV
jgi:hypothetical protein